MLDESRSDRGDDADVEEAGRRERVVGAVLARIAAAPSGVVRPSVTLAIAGWRRPVFAAAAVVLVAATAVLLAPRRDPADTVSESLGLPTPVARYLATGRADVWDWLRASGVEQ